MKIDGSNIVEQKMVKSRPFQNAKVSTSFLDTYMEKRDIVEKGMDQKTSGYDKSDLTHNDAKEEFQEKMAGALDAKSRKNQMAILSNTLSKEDYKALQEQGFSLSASGGKTIVTVTDKIKAQLAKAGVDISKMGGELSREQLEEIGGSIAAANQLEQAMKEADLPVTRENMADGMKAFAQAGELEELSESALKYLLDNGLLPSIQNLFMAEYASGENYQIPQESGIDFGQLQTHIEQVIQNAGYEVNDQTISDSRWMIQSGISYTAENFAYLEELKGMTFPIAAEAVTEAIAGVIAEGGKAADAMLIPKYSLTEVAKQELQVVMDATDEDLQYLVEHGMDFTIESLKKIQTLRSEGNLEQSDTQAVSNDVRQADISENTGLTLLKARRVMEEIRLSMTVEANRALLRQGISIDTKPLEELVEDLKQQEQKYYEELLSDVGVHSKEAAELYETTTNTVQELKGFPAYVLGIKERNIDTVSQLHEAGSAIKERLDKANESYETLMTAPRKDMGDSIQKAFANVDDILEDLNLPKTPENQRAVRILAYNQTQITEENIQTIKAADERVQRTFASLTPAVVREMIREGMNPLDMNLDVLNQTAMELKQGEENERFSEYLWKLEKNKSISQEERESYIGIYRLIHQVEKTDGAAIGALINQGAELTMRNLLTAVRSAKKGTMDYVIDEEFEGVEGGYTGKSITDQIETAYQTNIVRDIMEKLTPIKVQQLLENDNWEQLTLEEIRSRILNMTESSEAAEEEYTLEYAGEKLKELQQAAVSEEEIYQVLERLELPNTVDYVLAANRLNGKRNQVFSTLFNEEEVFSNQPVDFDKIKQQILEQFSQALESPKDMAKAQEVLADTAENVMKTMIAEDEHITSMDIKELKLMNTQIALTTEMSREENYCIPVLVGDEVTNMSLKIVRGKKQHGLIDIMYETAKAGKVAASIEAGEDGLRAFLMTDSKETAEKISKQADKLGHSLSGTENTTIQVAYEEHITKGLLTEQTKKESAEDKDREIQTKRLYGIARSFIQAIKEISA